MLFLKKTDLSLKNGGYLTTGKDKPVTHEAFVEQQVRAHYLVTLANKVKNANFKQVEVDSFTSILKEVKEELANSTHVYVNSPKAPVRKITNSLTNETLAWVKFQEGVGTSERINTMMQEFNTLNEFEEFGLYFTEGIVKLNGIYSVAQVLKAVTILEPHLD